MLTLLKDFFYFLNSKNNFFDNLKNIKFILILILIFFLINLFLGKYHISIFIFYFYKLTITQE